MAVQQVMTGTNLTTDPRHTVWSPGDSLADPDGNPLGVPSNPEIVYIDENIGDDASGDGSLSNPFKDLPAAVASIPVPTTPAEAAVPLIFQFGPGSYTGGVTLPKRVWVGLIGMFMDITGNVTMPVEYGLNFVAGPPDTNPAIVISNPLAGSFRNNDAKTFMLNGIVEVARVDAAVGSYANCQVMAQNIFMQGVHSIDGGSGAVCDEVNVNITNCDVEDGELFSESGAAGVGIKLEADNSIVKSTLCGRLQVMSVDGCRVGDIDATAAPSGYATPYAGLVIGLNSNSYTGFADCRFSGGTYIFGTYDGSPIGVGSFDQQLRFDAYSWRSIGGVAGATFNGFSNPAKHPGYDLTDVAYGVDYVPANVADWSGVDPLEIATALDRIAAAITPVP